MKPYIAVLYDSFIESVRSKVLWILLAAWTLILGALFPLAITEGESYQFSFADVANPKVMMDQLAAASAGKGTRAQRAVYAQIDKDFQEVLQQRQKNQRRIAVGLLIRSLNNVLSSESCMTSKPGRRPKSAMNSSHCWRKSRYQVPSARNSIGI